MAKHEKFYYKTFEEMIKKIEELHLDIPYDTDIEVLKNQVKYGKFFCPNALSIHPMEGCDSETDGSPSFLTFRRYDRFARGGAGLLWFEATAVVPEGRANPRQLWIHNKNVHLFEKLAKKTIESAKDSMGSEHRPLMILQLTHSGRYSKPTGFPKPVIAHHSKILDRFHKLSDEYPLISDEELDRLKEKYIDSARLAFKAGFDGIDIKSCHAYLINELLASFTRENSRYGGNFENRTRFLREVASLIRSEIPELMVTCRLNVFDAISFPYGFGVDKNNFIKPDLTEPMLLIEELKQIGIPGINVAVGNPYFNPHHERPYDSPIAEGYIPDEHPLENIEKSIHIIKEINQKFSDLTIVGSGFSWLRHFLPYIASGMIKKGWVSIMGLGRNAFAYPDFAKDIILHNKMEPTKVCISCSACSQIMKDGGKTGCVVRDGDIYSPIYKEGRLNNPDVVRKLAEICRNCVNPTCVVGCPANVDIPGFITAIAKRNEKESYNILRKSNMLPEICAYVCPVEVQCEKGCIQQYLGDNPIPINLLQRYIARRARKEGWSSIDIPKKLINKKIAVIGAGSSGLACAIRLLELGYKVTIFEKENKPGGLVTYTYPEYKIPNEAIDEEIRSILSLEENKELFWRFGKEISIDYNLDKVMEDRFDAVYIAVGLTKSAPLPNIKKPDKGVIDVLTFLRNMKFDYENKIPSKVAVLGGGNSAIDSAVVSKRAGAEDVYLIYRRSFEEMPAFPQERNRAINEGVKFLILTQPLDYVVDENNVLKGVVVAPSRLGKSDKSGRRTPQIIPNCTYVVEVDLVIEALGQMPCDNISKIFPGLKFDNNGLIVNLKDSRATDRERIYAGGDIVNGGSTAVQAIADGRQAAEEIHQYLEKNK
jgi:NADPH-dependent glutamate synthase beta subunit-like oxidoreductase/2,4-dienoyl-CoA reductase-like NADH-dependent reductase (Old Yellow Enzyme family)